MTGCFNKDGQCEIFGSNSDEKNIQLFWDVTSLYLHFDHEDGSSTSLRN
jgi:hypothetical protein